MRHNFSYIDYDEEIPYKHHVSVPEKVQLIN